jgi:hypothetical protein
VQWAPKLEQVRVTLSHIPAIDGLRVLAVGWVVAGNSLYGMGTSIDPVRAPTHPPSDGLASSLAAADDGAVSQRTGPRHALPHATQPRALASRDFRTGLSRGRGRIGHQRVTPSGRSEHGYAVGTCNPAEARASSVFALTAAREGCCSSAAEGSSLSCSHRANG